MLMVPAEAPPKYPNQDQINVVETPILSEQSQKLSLYACSTTFLSTSSSVSYSSIYYNFEEACIYSLPPRVPSLPLP